MPPSSIPIAAEHDWHENLDAADHEILHTINSAAEQLPATKIKALLLASGREVCRTAASFETEVSTYAIWAYDWYAASYFIYRQHLRRLDEMDALAESEIQIASQYPSYWFWWARAKKMRH
jgi:hypothetical protein